MALLDEYEIPVEGKRVAVLGRSRIVGLPLALMMMSKKRNATVTVCNSRTKELTEITKSADIIMCAMGKPEYITGKYVENCPTIIDVGINRVDDHSAKKGYRLVGDANFKDLIDSVSYITPVPGGVGPMTIACLMQNTLKAAENIAYGVAPM
jgi:5,10-methylene-tetrahydrofolate dehydrogenase/methenyl tetrahydrofolate cyclohydrolase